MRDIFIFGVGSFAKLMLHYFSTDSNYNVIGFCVDQEYFKDSDFCGLPVIPFQELNLTYPPSDFKVFIAIGYANMRSRKHVYDKIKLNNYECVNYISSKAIIDKSSSLGENNAILENSVIEPFVELGNNNIIWTSCNVCHNTLIKSHCFISSQSLIGGFCIVEDNCFLGFNSTILQNITLEKETLIGAKTLVIKNTQPYTKYVGCPAKTISQHTAKGIQIN